MTTDAPTPKTGKRRMTIVDCAVLALAIAALAAPIAARLQVQAHAATPQYAVSGEVSAIRPIDIALGYKEERAEAAFFEAQGAEEVGLPAEKALDIALARPAPEPVLTDRPIRKAPKAAEESAAEATPVVVAPLDIVADLSLARLIEPTPKRSIPDLVPPTLLDEAPEPESSDLPPKKEPDVARARMTAPPTLTPMPLNDPRGYDDAPEAVAEIAEAAESVPTVPLDVTPPSAPSALSPIEEAALPPLETEAVDEPAEFVMTEPLPVEELPADVTPAAPEVETAAAVPVPAEPKKSEAPAPKFTNGPRIALVIAAAGLNENVTRFAIEALPEGITLAFAPVKPTVGKLAAEAKADGHTILVEIPMEPVNKGRDPGPMTLRVGDSTARNLQRLEQALARVPVADGASTYLGARFNAVEAAAEPVVASLAERGLFLFENEPTARSLFQTIAAKSDLPYARGIQRIDRDRSANGIRDALDSLEKQARKRGSAIGVGTALRGTISTVALWAKEAEKRGVRFVPITETAR